MSPLRGFGWWFILQPRRKRRGYGNRFKLAKWYFDPVFHQPKCLLLTGSVAQAFRPGVKGIHHPPNQGL